tara:strand:+ start:306 stop:707 length:402 start_codon:yes stop_codon:yes gene_type:complete
MEYKVDRAINKIYGKLKGEKAMVRVPSLSRVLIIPSEKDYKKGFFKRFFVVRYDSAEVVEVDFDFYSNKLSELPVGIYSSTSFKWYLNSSNLPSTRLLVEVTPQSINENTVFKESKKMPQLLNTLKDFAQFVS